MANSNEKGLRKAAVLLSSLSNGQQTRLLDRLEPSQAATVAAEMAGLGKIADDEREALLLEFAADGAFRPNRRQPDRAAPFQFLFDLDFDRLLQLLADEHPQTIALILSCLPPRRAAAVLAELTPERQFSVVCRMATMREVSQQTISDVENVLRRRLHGAAGVPAPHCGAASVVKMLNLMEPAAERRLLAALAESDPQLARDIRRAMFGTEAADSEAGEQWQPTGEAC